MKELTASVWNTCKEWVSPFTDLTLFKSVLAAGSVGLGLVFGVEFYNFIFLVIWLVALDSFSGIWAAKQSGEPITSRQFGRVLPKMIRYLVFIASGHALQQVIGIPLYIENVVFIFIATTEFISIAENLAKVGMPIPRQLLNKIEELRDRQ